MDSRHVSFQAHDPALQLIYERQQADRVGATLVGSVRLARGQTVPAHGLSTHAADEYAFVLRGRVRMTSGGETRECATGTLVLVPAGEAHSVTALEDAELLWWWSGDDREFSALKQQHPFAH